MTSEEFDNLISELNKICEKYNSHIDFAAGTYEHIDVKIHIAPGVEEGDDNDT